MDALFRACAARSAAVGFASLPTKIINHSGIPVAIPGSILDRSAIMFEAVCAARIALVNSIPIEEAERRVASILAGRQFPRDTISIILRRPGSIHMAVVECLRHEELRNKRPSTPNYRHYQQLLHEALDRQIAAKKYSIVIDIPYGQNHITTLDHIVRAVHSSIPPDTVQSLFPYLLGRVKCVLAFGGLSECGKSTTATAIVARHNARSATSLSTLDLGRSGGAFRLKLVYLEGRASARIGKSLYSQGERTWALEVIHELDEFARIHKVYFVSLHNSTIKLVPQYLEIITLESLHNYEFTRVMRELIGDGVTHGESGSFSSRGPSPSSRLLVVYLDTPLELRASRTNAQGGGAKFDPSKDEVKRSRGAQKIRNIADLVCLNDRTQEETCKEVEKEIEKYARR